MKHYLILSLLFLLSSCGGTSLRHQWKDNVNQNKKSSETNVKKESEDSLAIKLTEFEQSLTVQEAQKIIKRHEKNLIKAQMALHDQIKAIEALGLLYLNNKFYLSALEQFERALELNPANGLLHYYAGISSGWLSNLSIDSYQQAKWRTKALAHLQKSEELNPTHALTAIALATIYSDDVMTLEQAKMQLKRYKSVYPDSLEAKLIEANIALRENNVGLAKNLYEQIITSKESQESQNVYILEQARRGISLIR